MTSRCWNTGFHAAAALAVTILAAVGTAADAADPVAIVEEIAAAKPSVQFMDYVTSGTVIRLRPADSLVLGYMRSCWRETIRGGVVKVGPLQSTVTGGSVSREKVECDGGRMRLSPAQAGSAGAMVYRGKPTTSTPLHLFGRSPVFIVEGGGLLIIKRSDDIEDPIELRLPAGSTGIAIHDMAKEGGALTAGAAYRAISPADAIDFSIDRNAVAGDAPIIGRVVRLRRSGDYPVGRRTANVRPRA